MKKIRKTLIQSYVILKSQKELFDIKKEEGKHFRTVDDDGSTWIYIKEIGRHFEVGACKVITCGD